MGLLAAYLLPAAAGSAALSITLGEAGAAAGSAAGQALVGAAITSGITSSLNVAGGDLQPTGLSPEVIRIQVWQKAAQIYREGLQQVEVQQRLHQLSLQAADLRMQVQQRLNRHETRNSILEMQSLVPNLYQTRTRLFPIDDIFIERLNQQRYIVDQINTAPRQNFADMERGIWILWLADLNTDESDIIDLDAIENHLANIGLIGPSGILGVDFGDWTSKEDELNAIFAGIRHASRIRSIFDSLQTGNVEVLTSPNPFSS